jgi:hypothetical protein
MRDVKILSNLTSFFTQANEENREIAIPYPEESMIVFAVKKGGRYISNNVGTHIDRDKFSQLTFQAGDGAIHIYVRKVDPVDYLKFLLGRPLYIGLIAASLLLYISLFYFTVKEFQVSGDGTLSEEAIAKIKALRLTLATIKLIPEESVEEMKKVVDSILSHKIKKK